MRTSCPQSYCSRSTKSQRQVSHQSIPSHQTWHWKGDWGLLTLASSVNRPWLFSSLWPSQATFGLIAFPSHTADLERAEVAKGITDALNTWPPTPLDPGLLRWKHPIIFRNSPVRQIAAASQVIHLQANPQLCWCQYSWRKETSKMSFRYRKL